MTDPAADSRPVVSIAEAAAHLGTSVDTLRDLVRCGRFADALDALPWRLAGCDADELLPDDEDD